MLPFRVMNRILSWYQFDEAVTRNVHLFELADSTFMYHIHSFSSVFYT